MTNDAVEERRKRGISQELTASLIKGGKGMLRGSSIGIRPERLRTAQLMYAQGLSIEAELLSNTDK